VLDAAEMILDQRGIEELLLRPSDEGVGYAPMAVYRHVRDKDELLD